jgi:predicted RNA-binding protein YlqC (UPF0109 family)
MSSIDQQFVEYIVKSLVGHPEDVKIERRIDEKGVLLELTVNPEDLGRVIGKRGATAQSIRNLLRALGTKNDARYNLKIIDNGPPREERYAQPYGNKDEEAVASDQPPAEPAVEPAKDEQPAEVKTLEDEPADDGETLEDESADVKTLEDKPAETEAPKEPVATPVDEPDEELDLDEEQKESSSNVVNKTREELKEYDDLDV